MKTLEEIKDEVCIEKCSCPFNELPPSREWIILDDIAERYSEERLTDFKDRLVSAIFSEPTIPVERKHTLKKLIDSL